MKNWVFLLKEHITIQRFILVMIVIITAAIIFSIVVILKPHCFPGFPLVRESVLALSTSAMVLATLILAYATIRIIKNDREREYRDRKERWINEVIDWASNSLNLGPTTDAGVVSLKGEQISIYQYANIRTLLTKGKHIYFISKSLDRILEHSVKDTLSKLAISFKAANKLIKVDNELRENKLTPEQHAAKRNLLTKELVGTESNLTKSANKVIRIASDIKTSLLA